MSYQDNSRILYNNNGFFSIVTSGLPWPISSWKLVMNLWTASSLASFAAAKIQNLMEEKLALESSQDEFDICI